MAFQNRYRIDQKEISGHVLAIFSICIRKKMLQRFVGKESMAGKAGRKKSG